MLTIEFSLFDRVNQCLHRNNAVKSRLRAFNEATVSDGVDDKLIPRPVFGHYNRIASQQASSNRKFPNEILLHIHAHHNKCVFGSWYGHICQML